METVAATAYALAAALFGVLASMLAGTWWQIWLHVRLRRAALDAEATLLCTPLPETLPLVVVQIPVYNEGPIVRRAVAAAAALDWPHDKIIIQVLDDSNDATSEIALAAVAEYQERQITVMRRDNRAEFKAGALKAGMIAVPQCAYFAILDVDYVPRPDFLKLTIRPLFADPSLGFSQARIDYLNAETNVLTQIQAIGMDTHSAIEQATRSWAGHPLPFHGTCGIWRRAAIDAAGGWRGDTLTEDLDLSYRAWLAGWRGRYLVTVTVPGELPAEQGAWVVQQRRWLAGTFAIARRMLTILRAAHNKRSAEIAGALLQFANSWTTPIVFCAVPAAVVAGMLKPSAILPLSIAGAILITGSLAAALTSWRMANVLLRPGQLSAGRFFKRCLRLQAYSVITVLQKALVYVDAFSARTDEFRRTPKSGSGAIDAGNDSGRLNAG